MYTGNIIQNPSQPTQRNIISNTQLVDADPDYRATKTWSGIPPPSSRDFHRVSSRDHRRDRSQQQQQQRMPTHEAPRPKPVDMRVSTDFLQCKPEQRLGIDDLVDTIRIKAGSAVSVETFSYSIKVSYIPSFFP